MTRPPMVEMEREKSFVPDAACIDMALAQRYQPPARKRLWALGARWLLALLGVLGLMR